MKGDPRERGRAGIHSERSQEETPACKAAQDAGGWMFRKEKGFCWEKTVNKRKMMGRGQTATAEAAPGASQARTHLLVVADLVFCAIGPSGSSRDGLPP